MVKTSPSSLGKVMYTLLYLNQITNQDLLYNTWNSAQCYLPARMGGGVWGRMDACMCMAESLHYSPETTTLLIGSSVQFSSVQFSRSVVSDSL